MSNLSKKAIKERNFRKRENERKRFEKPLRVFLQHKYKTIYEEYQKLYDLMVTNHPNKRNLVNTKTFKDWTDWKMLQLKRIIGSKIPH